MNRRKFAAALSTAAEKPAMDGGTPVRSTPLRAGYWGTQFYDEQERVQLREVTSGTAAIPCAIAALEIDPGDEVVIPSWTWHSCCNAVVLAGALPGCAEINHGRVSTRQSLPIGSHPRHRQKTQAALSGRLRGDIGIDSL